MTPRVRRLSLISRPHLAGSAALLTLCGLLFAATATPLSGVQAAVSADDAAGARRTPTPSDTPQPTPTAAPPVSTVSAPDSATPTPRPATAVPQPPELGVLFNDLEHLVISRYPDGALSFWRAHPERGDWGFVAWVSSAAQPGAQDAVIVDAYDEGWRLVVRRIDDCGGPAPQVPTGDDAEAWHFYAARVVARMMCAGRALYYFWLLDPAGRPVAEGAFVP